MSNPNIFISYRREDSEYQAGFIYASLVEEFGHDSVFLDVDKIPIGVDFAEYLDLQVSQCQVFIAVIGPQWVDVIDAEGNRRLENENDFVRIEIESALNRNIPVIPLLLNRAGIPSKSKLPDSMHKLVRRNGIQIRSGPDFNRDMERLIAGIEYHLKPTTIEEPNPPQEVPEGQESNRTVVLVDNFSEDLGNKVELEMVSIPAGSFQMGSPEGEEGRRESEGPQNRVTLETFFMGKYPVTQAQYEQVMGSNPATAYNAKRFVAPDKAVVEVSWDDATKFCERLTERTGRRYRLPSEAEWEYACRAGTTTPYHFGRSISSEFANFDEKFNGTTEVGKFDSNEFGLYDMHGNVWEWCADRWHTNYDGAPSGGTPWIEGGNSSYRVLRGGSWSSDARYCRSANRGRFGPGSRYDHLGFRVVCSSA